MSMRKTIWIAPAALALALAGCSGDEEPGAQTPTEAATTTASPSHDVAPPTASPPETDLGGGDDGNGETTGPGGSPEEEPPQEIPTAPVDYADAFVVAWGVGDSARMEQLASAEVVGALDEVGGPNWDQTGHDAGAGSSFVTYQNTEDGRTLELRVANEAASQGEAQAVVEAKVED